MNALCMSYEQPKQQILKQIFRVCVTKDFYNNSLNCIFYFIAVNIKTNILYNMRYKSGFIFFFYYIRLSNNNANFMINSESLFSINVSIKNICVREFNTLIKTLYVYV